MPIAATDILQKLSVKTGTAGNSVAGTPNGSLGKYVSTTQITDATLNNLFDDVTGDENAALESEYRCYFVHNAHATLTYIQPKVWISSQVAGGADASIAIDSTAASALAASAAQALEVLNEDTAPTGLAFSAPTTKATGLALGDLGPGQVRAIWVKRTTTNSAALNNDGVTIMVEGDTQA